MTACMHACKCVYVCMCVGLWAYVYAGICVCMHDCTCVCVCKKCFKNWALNIFGEMFSTI